MEIIKLDVVGFYLYNPDFEIELYDKTKNTSISKECIICKRSIYEPSYNTITNNKNIIDENEILIGKCGHIFHKECITNWLKDNQTCPIDKIIWHTFRTADSVTKLVINHTDNKKYKISTQNSDCKELSEITEPINPIKHWSTTWKTASGSTGPSGPSGPSGPTGPSGPNSLFDC